MAWEVSGLRSATGGVIPREECHDTAADAATACVVRAWEDAAAQLCRWLGAPRQQARVLVWACVRGEDTHVAQPDVAAECLAWRRWRPPCWPACVLAGAL